MGNSKAFSNIIVLFLLTLMRALICFVKFSNIGLTRIDNAVNIAYSLASSRVHK